jgi:hypothetical protein
MHTFTIHDLGQTDPPFEWLVTRDFDESEYDRTGKVSYLGPGFTEAEAHIVAFALGAIAAGRTLASIANETDTYTYDGPTDLSYPTDD